MVSNSLESGEATSGTDHGVPETLRSKSMVEAGTGAIGVSGISSPASSTGRRAAPKLRRKTLHEEKK